MRVGWRRGVNGSSGRNTRADDDAEGSCGNGVTAARRKFYNDGAGFSSSKSNKTRGSREVTTAAAVAAAFGSNDSADNNNSDGNDGNDGNNNGAAAAKSSSSSAPAELPILVIVECAMLAALTGLSFHLSTLFRMDAYFGALFPMPVVGLVGWCKPNSFDPRA